MRPPVAIKHSWALPVGTDADVVRSVWVRIFLLRRLLLHPTLRDATTRQAIRFVHAHFPAEPIVTFDVGCVHWLAATLPHETHDDRCGFAVWLWEEKHLWELERNCRELSELGVRKHGYAPTASKGLAVEDHTTWLYRSRVGREAKRSLARERNTDPNTVREGIKNAERLLRLPYRMVH